MSRLDDIVLVLRSLSWFEPSPETAGGNLERRFCLPGEGPSYRDACPQCGGEGERRIRTVMRPCVWCGGNLEQNRRGRGWVERDAYTNRQVGSVATGEHGERTIAVICDACGGDKKIHGRPCLHCRGSGVSEIRLSLWRATRVRVSLAAPELSSADPVCALLDRRADPDDLGIYAQTGLALGALRLERPPCYRTIVRLYVDCDGEGSTTLAQLGPAGIRRRALGLGYLSELLPEPIRVPPGVRAVERRRQYALRQQRKLQREETAA